MFAARALRHALRRGERGVGGSEGAKRRAEGGEATAVRAEDDLFLGRSHHLGHGGENSPLQGMRGIEIVISRKPLVDDGGQHAAVLAGAIALERRPLGQTQGDARPFLRVAIGRAAALQIVRAKPDLFEHRRDLPLVLGRGLVGGAAEGQLSGSEAEGVGGSAFDDLNRLKRLRGGAKEDDLLGVARRSNDFACRIDGDHNAMMDAFGDPAPCRLREYRRHRCLLLLSSHMLHPRGSGKGTLSMMKLLG